MLLDQCFQKFFKHGLQFYLLCYSLSYSFFLKDGTWNTEPQKTVKLGVLPVRSLLVMEDTIWAACGGQIFIISTVTHFIEVMCLKLIIILYAAM